MNACSATVPARPASRAGQGGARALDPSHPPLLGDVPCVESAHPCQMSAANGPFSRANALLEELGGEPVGWKLP